MNSRAITPFVPPSVPKAKDQPRAADTKTDATTNNEVTPTPDSKDLALEKLRVNELKTKLTKHVGKIQARCPADHGSIALPPTQEAEGTG